jgi:hypothetical protein
MATQANRKEADIQVNAAEIAAIGAAVAGIITAVTALIVAIKTNSKVNASAASKNDN